ncbi:MAG: hypothetical protein ACYDH9_04640 [Limisphaerales bacterium]
MNILTDPARYPDRIAAHTRPWGRWMCVSLIAVSVLTFPGRAGVLADVPPETQRGSPGNATDRHDQERLWKFQQRAYPLGYLPDGAREKALLQGRQGRTPRRRKDTGSTGPQWVNIGPAPIVQGQVYPPAAVSGRVTCIAVDPANASHWLVGAAQGGVWETTDAGATWVARTDDQPSLAMGAVAFAAGSPTIMFAGTGEPNSSDSYPGAGLLKSTDGGDTWQVLGAPFFAKTSFSAIRVHPTNANYLVVATVPDRSVQLQVTGSTPLPPLPTNGVYRSLDGGTNWTRTLTGPVIALETSANNFSNQFAATIVVDGGPSDSAGALYRSQNGGATWTRINGPWGSPPAVRAALATARSNPDTAYVCFVDGDDLFDGIWRTDNAWSPAPTWVKLPTPSSAARSELSQLDYNLAISVDPANANLIYFAELAVWKYDGTRWTTLAGHYDSQTRGIKIHPDQHALVWAGNQLLVGNDGGIWGTTNGGSSFASHNTTLATVQFYYGSVHPSNPNIALGGAQDNGSSMWFGTNGWQRAGPGDGAANAFSPEHPDDKWLVSCQNLYVLRNESGGRYQTYITDSGQNGIDRSAYVPFVCPLAICPINENRVIAGTASLWRCDNVFSAQTPTWNQNSPVQLITVSGQSYYDSVSAVAFAQSDGTGNTYAFATGSGGIYVTTSGGGTANSSWVKVTAGGMVPARYVTALAFDPTNPNLLYATLSGFDEGTPNKPGHLFRTRNALSASPSWAKIGPPVDIPHNCLAIDPVNLNTLYVGTDLGVWQTLDGGANWTHFGPESGMPNVAVYDLKVHPRTGRVFAFTHGRGAFSLDANVVGTSPAITGFTPTNGPAGTPVTIRGAKFDGTLAVRFNGVDAASFLLNSPTNITATVPATATTGPVSVITPNGVATSSGSFVVVNSPFILAFTPQRGNTGTVVTITGVNLTGASQVSFAGAASSVLTVNSSTQITATVPPGATTGRITITTPNGLATSADVFSVVSVPVIGGFSPAAGGVGTPVTITGANLTGATNVLFNNVPAAFTVDASSQITTAIPSGATTGLIQVMTPAGTAASPGVFVVIPTPAISGFTPSVGAVGTRVIITGTNFVGASAVQFNGLMAPDFLVNSGSQIVVTVPAGAATGPASVQTAGGIAVSSSPFTIVSPPPNDNFTAAQNLSGDRGVISGSNVAATKETGERNHAANEGGHSIWYRWTAPAGGLWTFTTQGSDFNTTLAVYTGNNVSNLTEVAGNDDAPGTNWSSVTFSAAAGTIYQIAVDGHKDAGGELGLPTFAASGNVSVTWQPATAFPPVITGFTPAFGSAGTVVTISGSNFLGATNVSFNTAGAVFQVNSSTRVTATVPIGVTSGPIRVSTPGGTATSLNSFSVTGGGAPPNDNFTNAQTLTGFSGTAVGSDDGATSENAEPAHAGETGGQSIWFAWTAPTNGVWKFDTQGSSFDTLLALYTGNSLATLSVVASNDDRGVLLTSETTVAANGGVTYWIAVDGYHGASGDVVLNWTSLSGAPSITSFTPATGGPGIQVTITGSGLLSAFEVGFNGVNTPSFNVDSDSQITATVPSGANSGPITVTTTNGTAASAGNFVVSYSRAPNDNFAKRLPLAGETNAVPGSNVGCTRETAEPVHAGAPGGRSVWWSWTAPRSATYRITTRGSDFDTLLGVYTGSTLAGLAEVVSNDDDPTMYPQSTVTLDAVAGVTYQIAVDGYDGAAGRVILSIYPVTPPATIYYTGFEASEGYSSGFFLSGQQGWKSQGAGDNGVDYNDFGDNGQQAYVGYHSSSPGSVLYVWQPLSILVDTNTRPVITFSTYMSIIDSTDGNYDGFGWDFYNANGDRLFLLDFDNTNLKIYYQVNGASAYVDSGSSFDNGKVYYLEVRMDFARNRWNAYLDNAAIVTEQPLSAAPGTATMGDIDAGWFPRTSQNGDNYMVFDDYWVRADVSAAPRLVVPPQTQAVITGTNVVLFVVADSGLSLFYQWTFNGANVAGATNEILDLGSVNLASAGAYGVVVSNAAGVVTSQAAVLTVQPLPNLTPYKPSAWSDKIVAATATNTTVDASVLNDSQDVFVDWAVLNTATNTDIANRFYTTLYVDNVLRTTWHTDGLQARHYIYVKGYALGKLAAGRHTLRIATDTTGVVNENNKNDNSYTKTLLVSGAAGTPPQLGSPTRSVGGVFQFVLSGTTLNSYAIQFSTDLTNWTALATPLQSDANGLLQFSDPGSTNWNWRFYRAALLATPTNTPLSRSISPSSNVGVAR